jgi:hypothetical protein
MRRAKQDLRAPCAKIFGVVLDNVDLKREGYYDYYYRCHSPYTEQGKEPGLEQQGVSGD